MGHDIHYSLNIEIYFIVILQNEIENKMLSKRRKKKIILARNNLMAKSSEECTYIVNGTILFMNRNAILFAKSSEVMINLICEMNKIELSFRKSKPAQLGRKFRLPVSPDLCDKIGAHLITFFFSNSLISVG